VTLWLSGKTQALFVVYTVDERCQHGPDRNVLCAVCSNLVGQFASRSRVSRVISRTDQTVCPSSTLKLRRYGDIYECASFLLARLMGQYCFARWRLSASSSFVVCNIVGRQARGWSGGQHARRASRVTSS